MDEKRQLDRRPVQLTGLCNREKIDQEDDRSTANVSSCTKKHGSAHQQTTRIPVVIGHIVYQDHVPGS